MIQKSFYIRIKQELTKSNPNIENLLYLKVSNQDQQQFNQFVLNYLQKFVTHHKYYQEIVQTFSKYKDKAQSIEGYQNLPTTMKQTLVNNMIRVYMTDFIRTQKELKFYRESMKKSEFNLQRLNNLKFGVFETNLDQKINKIVKTINSYQSFLTRLSVRQQNLDQYKNKHSTSQFPFHFDDQMRKIQQYVISYFQGLEVIKNYKLQLQEFQLDTEANFKQNIEIICKNIVRKSAQLLDIKLILEQIILKIKQNRIFPQVEAFLNQQTNSQIYKLFRQLKQQIDNLIKFNPNSQQPSSISRLLRSLSWKGYSYKSEKDYLKQLNDFIDKIYEKLPKTFSNATLAQKMRAIQQKFEGSDYCNQVMEEANNFSESLNLFVQQCFFYFGIQCKNYQSSHHIYNFALQDLLRLEASLKSRMKENLKNKKRIIHDFQVLDQSYMEKSLDYNMNLIKSKESQIKSWKIKYNQKCNELKKINQQNNSLKQNIRTLNEKLQSQKNQKQGKQLVEKQKKHQESIINKNKQLQQIDKELRKIIDKVEHQKQQLLRQIRMLSQQNQVYFNEKINLKNQLDIEKQRRIKQLKSLQIKKQREIDLIKKKFAQEKQNALSQISSQYEKQVKILNLKKQKIEEDFNNFKNKYYEQEHERLNKQILKFSQIISKSYVIAEFNNAFHNNQNQLSKEADLKQIIRLQEQNKKKYQDQLAQYKIKLSQIQNQLHNSINQIKKLQIILQQKTILNLQLEQNLKKQQQQRVLLQGKIKNNLEDIQRFQKTIHQLETNIRSQQQNMDTKTQIEENTNQQSQISSHLPTLVHYTRQLFNEDIFYDNEEEKKKLVHHLQWYARSRLTHTKLIYKFDIKNKANFHQYIDQIKGLALVIKTKNAIIAGFYPGVFKDKELLNKGGLIISVTNDKSYCLHQKKKGDNKFIYRGMIYDTFFAIYGNAQIRIKTGFKTVFSNFGVSNSYFNARGDKVDKFLNEGDKREVQFEYCQFYQVSFENQEPNFR